MGFGVWVFGLQVSSFGFGVSGFVFSDHAYLTNAIIQGPGFGLEGFGFGVYRSVVLLDQLRLPLDL